MCASEGQVYMHVVFGIALYRPLLAFQLHRETGERGDFVCIC